MATWITICDTCKRDGRHEGDMSADMSATDGERLAALVEEHAAATPLRTRRISCLMGCTHGCNVSIQASGKISYALGRFVPDADSARAIVDFALRHCESTTGQVPFGQWPQGVKGHFISRLHPLPEPAR